MADQPAMDAEYTERLRRVARSHGAARIRRARGVRPGEPLLSDRVQRVVLLHPAMPARPGRGRTAPVRPGTGRGGRGVHLQPARRTRSTATPRSWCTGRTCTRSTGSPPRSASSCPPANWSASRATRISSRRARISPSISGLPANRLVDSAELVNWVRVVKSPHEVAQLRIAGAIAERAMRTALRGAAAGSPAMRRRRRDHGRTGDRNTRTRRRLSRHRADAADRRGGRSTASDLDRPALPDRRSHHHRTGRHVRPLSRAAGADRDAGRTAAAARRDREDHRRGHGRDSGGDPPRRHGGAVHQAFDGVSARTG